MATLLAGQWFRLGLPMQAGASSVPGWGPTNPNPTPHVSGPKKKKKTPLMKKQVTLKCCGIQDASNKSNHKGMNVCYVLVDSLDRV